MINKYSPSTITTAAPSCGNRILAVLIQEAAPNDWEGEDEWKQVIRLIIRIYGKECCCEPVENTQRRLPLHLAVANGLSWCKGLRCIYRAHTRAVAEVDNITGLYPSILAATAKRPDLSSIFELLRRNPFIV